MNAKAAGFWPARQPLRRFSAIAVISTKTFRAEKYYKLSCVLHRYLDTCVPAVRIRTITVLVSAGRGVVGRGRIRNQPAAQQHRLVKPALEMAEVYWMAGTLTHDHTVRKVFFVRKSERSTDLFYTFDAANT